MKQENMIIALYILYLILELIKMCDNAKIRVPKHSDFFRFQKCNKKTFSILIIFIFTIFVNRFYNFPLLPPSLIPASTLVSKE